MLNRAPNVSLEVREKVERAMKALRYQPSHAARSLRSRSTKTIGCMFSDVTNPLYARAFRLAFGRPPTDAERAACLAHWDAMTARHKGLTFEKPERPTEITREAVEENTGVKFTFTEVLPSAADFVPDLHPADVAPEVRGLMEVCLVLFNANEFIYLD